MKKIIYVILFLLFINLVNAIEFNYTMNYTELPFTKTENILLKGVENLTVNIQYGNFTSGINSIYFTINTTNLVVNVNVPINTTPINYTDFVKIIADKENYSTNISFNFFIFDDRPKPETEYILLDINEYEYVICDYFIPYNTTLKNIAVRGIQGQTIYTDFNKEYFTLPESFVIPQQNYTLIDIKIHLKNLTVGRYNGVVSFSVISEFSNLTFHFNILDCLTPPPQISDILTECRAENLTVDQYMRCIAALTKYWSSYYEAIAEAQEEKIRNVTIKEYVNDTVYIPALPMDAETASILREIPLTWRQMQSDAKSKEKTITDLQNDIETLSQEVLRKDETFYRNRLNETFNSLIQDLIIKQNTIDYLNKKTIKWSTIIWLTFLLSIGIASFAGYKLWDLNNFW